MSEKIDQYRNKIDSIDDQILKLLSKRGECALAIGKLKGKEGAAIHVPAREKNIFDRLIQTNPGPYKPEGIQSIFREIISATRAVEAPVRVAFLGPEATFTHMAAVKYFGSSSQMLPVKSIQAIFEDVEKGHSDYGVVPIENSSEGVVSHTLDMFANSNLKVCGEMVLRVSHHLLSHETDLNAIKVVYSHPQALAQCRNWLANHLPHVVLKETESTAMAAKLAAEENGVAAIASEIAASVYQLPVLEQSIQDQTQNYTRFLVIGTHAAGKTGGDKTSILFVARDEVGALYKILGPLAKAKVNLSKIESRPLKKKAWEYMFFVDLDGHAEDKRIAKALEEVKKRCSIFKILGSYPKSAVVA
ncbi:MAG TPA: prephenate dehydratase [Deltaproteobacteria bacterium]|nr:MAG: chorismate mutase [Deltaproteobacteria bacterium GWA2_45_12]HBF13457.1 prephenate dehydratase [Deltaproteobacteria bacterium]